MHLHDEANFLTQSASLFLAFKSHHLTPPPPELPQIRKINYLLFRQIASQIFIKLNSPTNQQLLSEHGSGVSQLREGHSNTIKIPDTSLVSTSYTSLPSLPTDEENVLLQRAARIVFIAISPTKLCCILLWLLSRST